VLLIWGFFLYNLLAIYHLYGVYTSMFAFRMLTWCHLFTLFIFVYNFVWLNRTVHIIVIRCWADHLIF
jgi:hypothetical protein